MRQVLVLRPEPGASATVARAREMGLDAVAHPLFEIEPIAWNVPDAAGFDALLLTSANALRCAGQGLAALRGLPVHAVGKATAQAARAAGLDIASAGDAGVDRLLDLIEPGLKLLHLCGADRRAPQAANHAITPVIVYHALPIAAADLGSAADMVALVHSRRAAERLAELVERRESILVAAISPHAAAAAGDGWGAVEAATEPTDDALLALAARLCNKPAAK